MNFIFTCPRKGATFETEAFSLTDNQGIATTPDGRKVLKATVVLDAPCPLCGEYHRYRAEDLACPFESY
jgi:hypothetical protein